MEEDSQKITPEIVIEICGYIRVGVSFQVAAIAAGFTEEETREIWEKIESAESGVFVEFRNDIKRALAHFEIMQLQRIIQEGGAAGARWLLEKTNPGKWGNLLPKKREPKKLPSTEGDTDVLDGVEI